MGRFIADGEIRGQGFRLNTDLCKIETFAPRSIRVLMLRLPTRTVMNLYALVALDCTVCTPHKFCWSRESNDVCCVVRCEAVRPHGAVSLATMIPFFVCTRSPPPKVMEIASSTIPTPVWCLLDAAVSRRAAVRGLCDPRDCVAVDYGFDGPVGGLEGG